MYQARYVLVDQTLRGGGMCSTNFPSTSICVRKHCAKKCVTTSSENMPGFVHARPFLGGWENFYTVLIVLMMSLYWIALLDDQTCLNDTLRWYWQGNLILFIMYLWSSWCIFYNKGKKVTGPNSISNKSENCFAIHVPYRCDIFLSLKRE